MTVQFVGLDDNEGVIASDTRVIKKDGNRLNDNQKRKDDG